MDQDPEEETEGVDTAGIDRLHKFQQDMNKIIEERDANSLVIDHWISTLFRVPAHHMIK